MVIFTGRWAKREAVWNSVTRSSTESVSTGPVSTWAGWVTLASFGVMFFGRVSSEKPPIWRQKWLSMAFGGALRLLVRRCISPVVMMSMPAASWSAMAPCPARN